MMCSTHPTAVCDYPIAEEGTEASASNAAITALQASAVVCQIPALDSEHDVFAGLDSEGDVNGVVWSRGDVVFLDELSVDVEGKIVVTVDGTIYRLRLLRTSSCVNENYG